MESIILEKVIDFKRFQKRLGKTITKNSKITVRSSVLGIEYDWHLLDSVVRLITPSVENQDEVEISLLFEDFIAVYEIAEDTIELKKDDSFVYMNDMPLIPVENKGWVDSLSAKNNISKKDWSKILKVSTPLKKKMIKKNTVFLETESLLYTIRGKKVDVRTIDAFNLYKETVELSKSIETQFTLNKNQLKVLDIFTKGEDVSIRAPENNTAVLNVNTEDVSINVRQDKNIMIELYHPEDF